MKSCVDSTQTSVLKGGDIPSENQVTYRIVSKKCTKNYILIFLKFDTHYYVVCRSKEYVHSRVPVVLENSLLSITILTIAVITIITFPLLFNHHANSITNHNKFLSTNFNKLWVDTLWPISVPADIVQYYLIIWIIHRH